MDQQGQQTVLVGPDGLPLHFAENYAKIKQELSQKIYKAIATTRAKGMSQQVIEVHFQSAGYSNAVIAKSIKELMTLQLIAMVSVNNKKVYCLAEYRPQEQNKPAWYTLGHYDEAYVALLFQLIKNCVSQARTQVITMDYIVNLIRNSQNLRSRMQDDDIKALVLALVNSSELIEYDSISAGQKCYMLPSSTNQGEQFQSYFQGNYWRTVPCGRCQMLKICGPSQGVSASVCTYMREWLQGK